MYLFLIIYNFMKHNHNIMKYNKIINNFFYIQPTVKKFVSIKIRSLNHQVCLF